MEFAVENTARDARRGHSSPIESGGAEPGEVPTLDTRGFYRVVAHARTWCGTSLG
jgi:hypothetical protein